MTLEEKIAQEVARQIGPLNAVLHEIWTEVQVMKAARGEALVDPDAAAGQAGEKLDAPQGWPPTGWAPARERPEGPAGQTGAEAAAVEVSAGLAEQMQKFSAEKVRLKETAVRNRLAEMEAQIAARMAVWNT